jgi:hypothetical protein
MSAIVAAAAMPMVRSGTAFARRGLAPALPPVVDQTTDLERVEVEMGHQVAPTDEACTVAYRQALRAPGATTLNTCPVCQFVPSQGVAGAFVCTVHNSLHMCLGCPWTVHEGGTMTCALTRLGALAPTAYHDGQVQSELSTKRKGAGRRSKRALPEPVALRSPAAVGVVASAMLAVCGPPPTAAHLAMAALALRAYIVRTGMSPDPTQAVDLATLAIGLLMQAAASQDDAVIANTVIMRSVWGTWMAPGPLASQVQIDFPAATGPAAAVPVRVGLKPKARRVRSTVVRTVYYDLHEQGKPFPAPAFDVDPRDWADHRSPDVAAVVMHAWELHFNASIS